MFVNKLIMHMIETGSGCCITIMVIFLKLHNELFTRQAFSSVSDSMKTEPCQYQIVHRWLFYTWIREGLNEPHF